MVPQVLQALLKWILKFDLSKIIMLIPILFHEFLSILMRCLFVLFVPAIGCSLMFYMCHHLTAWIGYCMPIALSGDVIISVVRLYSTYIFIFVEVRPFVNLHQQLYRVPIFKGQKLWSIILASKSFRGKSYMDRKWLLIPLKHGKWLSDLEIL